jgi:protein-disulfide isomerase
MSSGNQSENIGEASSRAARAGWRPSRRTLIAAGVIAILVIVGVVLAVVFSSGSGGNSAAPLSQGTQVEQLLGGIPQKANTLGADSAPVTLVEYVDLGSPQSRDFQTKAMPLVISRYVRPDKVRVELRPLGSISNESVAGRFALISAGDQDKMFDLAQVLFLKQGARNSGWLDTKLVMRAGASIPGLDAKQVVDQSRAGQPLQRAYGYDDQAHGDRVVAVPTVLVGLTGKKLKKVALKSATDTASVRKAIDSALSS